jgi:hypothetical protein
LSTFELRCESADFDTGALVAFTIANWHKRTHLRKKRLYCCFSVQRTESDLSVPSGENSLFCVSIKVSTCNLAKRLNEMMMHFRRRFTLGVKRERKIMLRHFRFEILEGRKDVREEK